LESYSILESINFPLVHPPYMLRDVEADAWSDRHLFGISRWTSIKSSIRQLPCVDVLVRAVRYG